MPSERFCLLALYGTMCLLLTGCSMVMAARAPERKDMSVLMPGIPRSQVVATLGAPSQTRQTDQGAVDVMAFKQGYSTSSKVSRMVVHGVADLFTIGLWEIVATPLESSLQGEAVQAEVVYDQNDRVRAVQYYSGAHLANGNPALAPWMRSSSVMQTGIVGDRSALEHSTQATSPPQQRIMPASATSYEAASGYEKRKAAPPRL